MDTFKPRYLLVEGLTKAGKKISVSLRCRPAGNSMILVPATSWIRVWDKLQIKGVPSPVFSAAAVRHDAYAAFSSRAPVEVRLAGSLVMPDHSLFVSFVRSDYATV